MAIVVVGLGSNLGDRASAMQRAIDELSDSIRWDSVSSLYETAPMYVEDQPPFLNATAIGSTDFGPFALLRRLKETESKIGREERVRYGPREIDLDLIAYGSLALRSRGERSLELPHPKTPERRFVLAPVYEIAPGLMLPGLGAVAQLFEATNAQAQDVKRINDAVLSVCRNRPAG